MYNLLKKLEFFWIGLIAFFIGVFIVGVYFSMPEFNYQKDTEYTVSNQSFKIRVKREYTWKAMNKYVFQSRENTSNTWKTIYAYEQDDLIPLPKEKLTILNKKVGYFFFHSVYGVTVDKGKTWKLFDLAKEIDIGQKHSLIIKGIQIDYDGSGTLTFVANEFENKKMKLVTRDFGESWRKSD